VPPGVAQAKEITTATPWVIFGHIVMAVFESKTIYDHPCASWARVGKGTLRRKCLPGQLSRSMTGRHLAPMLSAGAHDMFAWRTASVSTILFPSLLPTGSKRSTA
jgi:hypothetical protein